MKILLQGVLVIVFVSLSFVTTKVEIKSMPVPLKELSTEISTDSIIENRYAGYKPVVDKVAEEKPKEAKKQQMEVDIDKFEDRKSEDYLGSIYIPAIKTSEPIYKGEGDYYLSHNYLKTKNKLGEVYLDDRTVKNLSTNGALLNGHAVPNGSKFGNFKKLLDEENQPVYYVWENKTKQLHKYKILFVSLIDNTNSGVILRFKSLEHQTQYYNSLYDTAIKKWEKPKLGNSYMLLNSCAYIIDNGRYLVVAKKEV